MRSTTTLLFAASIAAALAHNPLSAQSFDIGTKAINLGIGVGGHHYGFARPARGTYVSMPAFSASLDIGMWNLGPGVVGLGGFFAHKTIRYDYIDSGFGYTYNYNWRYSYTQLGARGSWHWNDWHGNDRLDLYAGVMLGYNVVSSKNKSTYTVNGVTSDYGGGWSSGTSGLIASPFAGCRYLFTEKFGVYGEIGYGIAYLNAGVTLVL